MDRQLFSAAWGIVPGAKPLLAEKFFLAKHGLNFRGQMRQYNRTRFVIGFWSRLIS